MHSIWSDKVNISSREPLTHDIRTTRYTTAKITAQHGLIYHRIAKRYNIDYAHLYLKAGLDALTEYEKLCSHINCDFEYLWLSCRLYKMSSASI